MKRPRGSKLLRCATALYRLEAPGSHVAFWSLPEADQGRYLTRARELLNLPPFDQAAELRELLGSDSKESPE